MNWPFEMIVYDSFEDWWHQCPKGSLGGSSGASVLCGSKSGWGGPWSVWQDAKREVRPLPVNEPWQQRGHDWEPKLIAEWQRRHPNLEAVTPICRVYQSTDRWLCPSPDGLALSGLTPAGGIEAKTVSSWDNWGHDGMVIHDWDIHNPMPTLPRRYGAQVLIMLAVTQVPWWDVVAGSLNWQSWTLDVRVIRMMRQPRLQTRLMNDLRNWHHSHIARGLEPPIDGSRECNQALAQRPFEGDGDLSVDVAAMAREYHEMGSTIREMQADRDEKRNMILGSIGDRKRCIGHGWQVTKSNTTPRKSISYARVAKDAPDMLEKLESRGLVTHGKPGQVLRVTNQNKKVEVEA